MISFMGLPTDFQEMVFQALGELGSDQIRSTSNAAHDILNLGSTCKHLHGLQMAGVKHLAACCPAVVVRPPKRNKNPRVPRPGGYKPFFDISDEELPDLISDSMWDHLISKTSKLKFGQLVQMTRLIPYTRLLHRCQPGYGYTLARSFSSVLPDRSVKSSLISTLLKHFGLKTGLRIPTTVPAKLIAAVQRDRKVINNSRYSYKWYQNYKY